MGGYISSDIIKPFRLKNEDTNAKNNKNTSNSKQNETVIETVINYLEDEDDESTLKDLIKMVGYKKYEGELIQLMQIAIKNNKYDKVDDYIKTEVVKYLYNDGRGKYV
jgi:hypothetical protein